SIKAVSFSCGCTTNLGPLARCASTIQSVRTLQCDNCHAAPTPTGFAEIFSDDLPVLHAARFCLFRSSHSRDRVIYPIRNESDHRKSLCRATETQMKKSRKRSRKENSTIFPVKASLLICVPILPRLNI